MSQATDLVALNAEVLTAARLAVHGGTTIAFDPISNYVDTEDALFPGQMAVQVRTRVEEYDIGSDSNVTSAMASHEVTVSRALITSEFSGDESLFAQEEMLYAQARLLERNRWKALTKVEDVIEEPRVEGDITREGNTMSYTVAWSVRLVQPT